MPGGAQAGAGRKPAKIDLMELEKLCMLGCTDEEIAGFFGVSARTIQNRRKERKFAEAMARGRAKGKISVRRAQMKLMEGGNASVCIWLGKQLLGQREVTPLELSGPQGQPVQFSLESLDEAIKRARERASAAEDH